MDVFLQSILLAGIGVCVWLAFHPSSRENYDDFENPRKSQRPPVVHGYPEAPASQAGEGRLVGQHRAEHDDLPGVPARPSWYTDHT